MKNFHKIFELVKKTGDRFVVEDNQGDLFVIMDMAQYENLALGSDEIRTLSKEELVNKLNKDISIWKSEQEEEELTVPQNFPNFSEENTELSEAELEEDKYYFEPNEDAF